MWLNRATANGKWQCLLGYGYKDEPESGNWVRPSSVLDPDHFPAASTYHLGLWVKQAEP